MIKKSDVASLYAVALAANAKRLFRDFFRFGRPRRTRSLLQFAQEEIVIPEGRYRGRKWRAHFQPFTGEYFRLIDSGRYTHFAVTGCVQSGKSFASFVVPAIYHLFELEETVILAAPSIDIARDKWNLEIRPVLEQTRFATMMPDRGAGSRQGWSEMVKFKNGSVLKFMSGHGGDEKRSSITSRVVIITEADKMDEAGAVSKEASPVRQILARTESYDIEEVRAYMECTVSTEDGFIWQEYNAGTASQLLSPCPHCGGWIAPGRDDLVGWSDAGTAMEAEESAWWKCPRCGGELTEAMRMQMLRNIRTVHRGQDVDTSGQIQGQGPLTRQLGFRWWAWHNTFWSTKKIAHGEWRAANDVHEEDVERYRKQFVWCEPYAPPDVEPIRLSEIAVTERKPFVRRGIVPSWAVCTTVGVDVGKYWLHWVACSWRRNLGLVDPEDVASAIIQYGVYRVDDLSNEELSISNAIINLGQTQFTDIGFAFEGSPDKKVPECILIDSGYKPVAVRAAVRQLDRQRFFSLDGCGAGQHKTRKYHEPSKRGNTRIRHGDRWHIRYLPDVKQHEFEVDVDYWKSWATRRLATTKGPGSLVLYDAEPREHQNIAKHFTAERETRYFDHTRNREASKWERIRHQNHYFDALVYACAAANFYGVKLLDVEQPHRATVVERPFNPDAAPLKPGAEPGLTTHLGMPYAITDR